MELAKMKTHLLELIRNLRIAEKSYDAIASRIDNALLSDWLEKQAREKHGFHRELALSVINLGGEIDKEDVKKDEGLLFHDLKLNNFTDHYQPILNEIERATLLLKKQYDSILASISFTPRIHDILMTQKNAVEEEYRVLIELKDKIISVPSSD